MHSIPDIDKLTEAQLQLLENRCRERRAEIFRARMRVYQIHEVDKNPDATFSWLGEIGQFCEDLCFHAKRLGRSIKGEFNKIEIVASPQSFADDLIALYFAKRHR